MRRGVEPIDSGSCQTPLPHHPELNEAAASRGVGLTRGDAHVEFKAFGEGRLHRNQLAHAANCKPKGRGARMLGPFSAARRHHGL
jgi:hypothetical protein